MSRGRSEKLAPKIREALDMRLRGVARAMAAALRDDEFFAELPEKKNMAKGGAEA